MDLKAEVIAAELIDNGTASADRIMIMMLGASQRSYRKDVDAIDAETSAYDHKEYQLVKTHKEGIYDMLPEGLFHTPALPKNATTEKEILEYMRRHRKEEQDARRFFLPFEAAINQLRIQQAQYESRLDKGAHYDELVELFTEHWEIFQYMDTAQANIFLQILPLIHDIRDDHHRMETIFEMLFELPLKVTLQRQRPLKLEQPVFSTLSDCRLGVDLTTACHTYDSGEDELILTIGPLNNQQLALFAPDTRYSRLLQLLCGYLLPVHIETSIVYELSDTHKIARLTDENSTHNTTLGLSTYL